MKIEKRKIEDLKNWEHNPRTVTKEAFERLIKQIKELEPYKPLLIAEDGTVIGGNMRLRAFKEMGIDEIECSVVHAPAEEQKLKYALSDNDQVGKTDAEVLANLIGSMPSVDFGSYAAYLTEPTRIQELIDRYKEVEEDEPPAVEGVAVSKLGEVYQLGRHRLMCGDSTKIEDVEKLMDRKKADMVFTDPPYGMDLDTDYSSLNSKSEFVKDKHLKKKTGNTYGKVIGDNEDYNPQHLFDMFPESKEMFLWGGDYYCKRLPDNGSWIVWDKRQGEQFDKMYGSCFELLWSRERHKRDIIRHTWTGIFGTEQEDMRGRVHPTQKPIGVNSWVINKYSDKDWIVVDLFGGSGSTLIACEQTNRTCYMMELDPKYVDVIRKRYANFIGKGEEWEKITTVIDNKGIK